MFRFVRNFGVVGFIIQSQKSLISPIAFSCVWCQCALINTATYAHLKVSHCKLYHFVHCLSLGSVSFRPLSLPGQCIISSIPFSCVYRRLEESTRRVQALPQCEEEGARGHLLTESTQSWWDDRELSSEWRGFTAKRLPRTSGCR